MQRHVAAVQPRRLPLSARTSVEKVPFSTDFAPAFGEGRCSDIIHSLCLVGSQPVRDVTEGHTVGKVTEIRAHLAP